MTYMNENVMIRCLVRYIGNRERTDLFCPDLPDRYHSHVAKLMKPMALMENVAIMTGLFQAYTNPPSSSAKTSIVLPIRYKTIPR